MTRVHEAAIVGGGLAGSSLAHRLASAGRDVVLVERTRRAHDKVCGEFISQEAIAYLRSAGVNPAELGATPIESVSLAVGENVAEKRLPFEAVSLSRRQLDEALLTQAAMAGARLRRGRRATRLERVNNGWRIDRAGGEPVMARHVFIATGKHELRGHTRPPGGQNDLIGFKRHYRFPPTFLDVIGHRVELYLFPGGYGGMEPIEDDKINLCLLVRKSRFAALGGTWERLFDELIYHCPTLADRLRDAVPVQEPLAIASIPYGFVRRKTTGEWHLGDQAAVIPSFAGEGMSIALHSGHLAADLYLDGRSAAAFQHRLAEDVARQVRRASVLSRLMVVPAAQKIVSQGLWALPFALERIALATRLPAHRLRLPYESNRRSRCTSGKRSV